MATLTGNSIASTYTQLLKLTSATLGADASAKYIEDGAGTDSALSISTTRVGIGIDVPDGTLHVHTASAGSVTAVSTADDLVVESSGNGGISILTPDASNANIFFGSPTDSAGALIRWNHDGDFLELATANAGAHMKFMTANEVEAMRITSDGTQNQQANYIVNEQGRQDHVANTMPAPYYRFDGVDDSVDLNTTVPISQTLFTVSGWCLPNDISGNEYMLGAMDSGSNRFYFRINSNYYRWGLGSTSSTNTDALATIDVWQHFAFTYDNTNVKIYVNGVLKSTEAYASDESLPSTDLHIGALNNNTTVENNFNGQISDIQLFNLALTATEVKELYSGASVPYKYKGASQTNRVSNGTFTGNATGWTLNTGWAYDSNNVTATSAANTTIAYQTPSTPISLGEKWLVTYTISNYSAGGTNIRLGGSYVGTTRSSNGTFTEELTCLVAGNIIGISAVGTTSLTIDDVSFIKLGAVAEYDGSGASDTVWYDKSGNDLNGTVTGATLENKLDTIQTSGITFPATAHGSSNANTLDDYEEGTWTPVLKSGSNTISFSANGTATYTKIGNKVTVQWSFRNVTTSGTLASGTTIEGLPFTAGTANYSVGSIFNAYVLHFDVIPNLSRIETGTTVVTLLNQPASANYGATEIDAVGSGSYGGFTMTYWV